VNFSDYEYTLMKPNMIKGIVIGAINGPSSIAASAFLKSLLPYLPSKQVKTSC